MVRLNPDKCFFSNPNNSYNIQWTKSSIFQFDYKEKRNLLKLPKIRINIKEQEKGFMLKNITFYMFQKEINPKINKIYFVKQSYEHIVATFTFRRPWIRFYNLRKILLFFHLY